MNTLEKYLEELRKKYCVEIKKESEYIRVKFPSLKDFENNLLNEDFLILNKSTLVSYSYKYTEETETNNLIDELKKAFTSGDINFTPKSGLEIVLYSVKDIQDLEYYYKSELLQLKQKYNLEVRIIFELVKSKC